VTLYTLTDEQHCQDERTGGPDKLRKTVDRYECYVFGASFQHDQADRLDESIETAYRVCVGTANAAQRGNVRKYHLNRLLIHCFAGLFTNLWQTVQQRLHLSRCTILGLLAAAQQILGDDLYTKFDECAEALVNSFASVRTSVIPWDTVYRNEAGQLIL